jgi:hypothetical protein
MRYLVLAADYDGTLAHHGRMADATVLAIERLRTSGRRVILMEQNRTSDVLSHYQELARSSVDQPRSHC